MLNQNILKQIIRFITVQSTLTVITILYFDNFLIGDYLDGFVIILENLLEDKDRFYPFINSDFVKLDFYIALYVFIFMILLQSSNFYNYSNDFEFKKSRSYLDEYINIFLLWTSSFMIFIVLFRFTILSRGYLILFNLIIPLILLLLRNTEFLSTALGRSAFSEKFISINLHSESLIYKIRLLTLRSEVAKLNKDSSLSSAEIKTFIDEQILNENVNLIVLKITEQVKLSKDLEEYLLSTNKKILIVSDQILDFYNKFLYKLVEVESKYLVYLNNDIQYGSRYLVKRLIDIVFSFFILLLTIPFIFFITLFILISDGFPPIIKQERIGLHGKKFSMYKFRTMKVDSHKEREFLQKLNEHDGPLFKIEDDPRFIKGARLIRKFSLDELPQIINIFKGEMSLVGPRPLFAEDNAHFDEIYIRRLNVLPGLTGLLQINERNTADFEIWHKYDMQYMENWSIYNDLKIILKTPLAIFKSRNSGI
jgi:lipopolysaccharide/colanic/teichoic acid biosynthesis glycosyltransferase